VRNAGQPRENFLDLLVNSVRIRQTAGPEDSETAMDETAIDIALYVAGAIALLLVLLFYPGGRISRRQYQETLRDLPIGVFSLRGNGRIRMWNRSMEEITGTAAERTIGRDLSALPEPWSGILEEFVHSPRNNDPRVHLSNPGGPDRWIGLHKSLVQSFWRRGQGPVIVVEDLTDDYERLEQELMHSERLASVGRLAAGVAHEIGNPVAGIACLAQNLEYEEETAAIQKTAADILQQTERVGRIVESLVNFSHTGRGLSGSADSRAVNLADCIDEAVHLLELDHRAKPVRFVNRCDREHLVSTDSQHLLQVFINLLGNARDASPENGRIEVDSECSGDETIIEVRDEGAGIPAEIQAQVFEPFFTTKEPGEGTGLGLSLVYSILKNLGGRIALRSPVEDDRGTCFRIALNTASYGDEYPEADS